MLTWVYERVTHLKMFEGVDIIIRLMQLGDGKGGETPSHLTCPYS